MASPNFVVIPSIGQLNEGHLLILPATHKLSLGQLDGAERLEFEALKDRVRFVVTSLYSDPICFEHGCITEGGGCGVYHAHLHVVPVAAELPGVRKRLAREFHEHPVVSCDLLATRIAAGRPYLFFETRAGQGYMYEVDALPSQFMRRLVSEELGHSQWDWTGAGFEESLVRVAARLEAVGSRV